VRDLTAAREGSKVVLRWQNPAGVRRYHILWSTKPISERYGPAPSVCNWWAARPVANRIEPQPGKERVFEFTVPKDKAAGPLYVGVFSFDSKGNQSRLTLTRIR